MHRVKMEDWICRVEGISSLTRQNLEELQLKKLNRMLRHLAEKGGIWEALPQELSSLSQLQTLPFTTPQMLREHPGQFLNCSQSEVSRVISEATSGTTGGAKRVFYSDGDLQNTVDFFASGISEMLAPGEKCLIGFPVTGPSGLGDLIVKAVEKLGAVPIRTSPSMTYEDYRQLLIAYQPETYIGFPVPLLSILRLYGPDFPVKRALISGDSCPRAVWDALARQVRLYPHYGSRETALGGAVTCPAFEGMHLRENHILAEIIDEKGSPVPEGTWGELVITTIGLEAMPLLRYRTGDLSRFLAGPCPCGGVTRRLDRVVRQEKGPVSMEKLDGTLFSLPELIDYRAIFNGSLQIEAYTSGKCPGLQDTVQRLYPNLRIQVLQRPALWQGSPAYPGKRHLIILTKENCL